MVLISKEEKRAIFTYLLREGVIVVRKDAYLPMHQSISGVSNLKVMMIVKSLKSQGFLSEVFNWQWSYYTVSNSGVNFLVKKLGVAADVVPATFRKKRVAASAPKVDDDEKAEAQEGQVSAGRGAR